MLDLAHMNAAVEISGTVFSLTDKSEVLPWIIETVEVCFINDVFSSHNECCN